MSADIADESRIMTRHPCGLERTFCDRCGIELEEGQVGLCGGCVDEEKTEYAFDELSDCAKEHARDEYRGEGYLDYEWWEFACDDFVTIAKLMGVEIATKAVKLMSGKTREDPAIYFSGFWCQGDGASFEGRYSHASGAVKAVTEYAPQDEALKDIASRLTVMQFRAMLMFGETLSASIKCDSRYNHSGTMDVTINDFESTDLGSGLSASLEEELQQCMRDLADWLYATLETEHDYLMSDECVDQYLSDETYDEDGNSV